MLSIINMFKYDKLPTLAGSRKMWFQSTAFSCSHCSACHSGWHRYIYTLKQQQFRLAPTLSGEAPPPPEDKKKMVHLAMVVELGNLLSSGPVRPHILFVLVQPPPLNCVKGALRKKCMKGEKPMGLSTLLIALS